MTMQRPMAAAEPGQRPFNPLGIVLAVLAVLVGISLWSRWYAEAVSTHRYCEDTDQTMEALEKVLTSDRPAGNDSRLPYLIAAKLLFLVPRRSDEPVADYLGRVHAHLDNQCRSVVETHGRQRSESTQVIVVHQDPQRRGRT